MQHSPWKMLFCEDAIPCVPETAFFKCPSPDCAKVQPSTNPAFQRKDLDVKANCKFCLRHEPVRQWKCDCGLRWHLCDVHKHCYTQGGRTPKQISPLKSDSTGQSGNGPRKRSAGSDEPDYEAILTADLKKAKCKQERHHANRKAGDIVLDDCGPALKRPTVLGPILQARFGGTSASSSS